MKRITRLPKTVLKCLYQSLGISRGEPLGEQLLSLDRSANTMGLVNWHKKEYR